METFLTGILIGGVIGLVLVVGFYIYIGIRVWLQERHEEENTKGPMGL